jgi:hypothetical protein
LTTTRGLEALLRSSRYSHSTPLQHSLDKISLRFR